MSGQSQNWLNSLDPDTISEIASKLSLRDLGNLSRINKGLNESTKDSLRKRIQALLNKKIKNFNNHRASVMAEYGHVNSESSDSDSDDSFTTVDSMDLMSTPYRPWLLKDLSSNVKVNAISGMYKLFDSPLSRAALTEGDEGLLDREPMNNEISDDDFIEKYETVDSPLPHTTLHEEAVSIVEDLNVLRQIVSSQHATRSSTPPPRTRTHEDSDKGHISQIMSLGERFLATTATE